MDTKKNDKKYSKKNDKKYSKKNSKKNSKISRKRKNTYKKGGGILNNIGKSIIQVPNTKSYNVQGPGSGIIKSFSSLSSSLSESSSTDNNIKIIFGYPSPNQYDITKTSNPNIIPSSIFVKAPHIAFQLPGKYLFVLYREVNKKNSTTPTLLLHYLAGYNNSNKKDIFYFKDTKIKPGRIQNFFIKLYKYPLDDKTNDFVKIDNYKKKLAYNEFNTYIINNNLTPDNLHTYRFSVRGV